jgi:hypothetical protein
MSQADMDLVPDQFPALNERFYERCPAEYFGHRLRLLLTLWGRPDDVLDLYEEGVNVGELSVGGHVDLREDSVERFVAADLEVLWHHTAESMMRAYLAHRDLPECPWLEVARCCATMGSSSGESSLKSWQQARTTYMRDSGEC